MQNLKGKAWIFGAHVNTDDILPARHLNRTDPEHLASVCFEIMDPEFARKADAGSIIVAGPNFGCGSSREHAPVAIKAKGVPCVIADSFARIFYRNAFNIGLPVLESPRGGRKGEKGA
jgi:3-isopropylmalate/(R)-2-methylmalate dehydratase small subunit